MTTTKPAEPAQDLSDRVANIIEWLVAHPGKTYTLHYKTPEEAIHGLKLFKDGLKALYPKTPNQIALWGYKRFHRSLLIFEIEPPIEETSIQDGSNI